MQGITPSALERMQHTLDQMPKPGVLVAVSKCEGDDFLYVVLVERYNDEMSERSDWVTWWWNDQSQGFSTGHYHRSELRAILDFIERSKSSWNYERKMAKWGEEPIAK